MYELKPFDYLYLHDSISKYNNIIRGRESKAGVGYFFASAGRFKFFVPFGPYFSKKKTRTLFHLP
jgi:hypothetical protein